MNQILCKWTKSFCFCLMLPIALLATDLKPWFSKDFELQPGTSLLYQHYDYVAAPYKSVRHRGRDGFYSLSMGLSALDYSGEVEGILARTRRQKFDCDSLKLTGRYRLMNDLVGDPVSLTGGITVIQAFKHSVTDISSFHHGEIEMEIHAAAGKEETSENIWSSRQWGLIGIGMADRGWPWLRTHTAWEKNFCDRYQLGFFIETLWGFGKRSLHRDCPFHGYGSINHQSVDIGVKYQCQNLYGRLTFEARYRAYARNFPKQTAQFLIQMVFPISPADWLPTQFLLRQISMKECK